MSAFTSFIRNFEPKDRAVLDDAEGVIPPTFATTGDRKAKLYEGYLRRMRRTGETNLNLDVRNLLAQKGSKKLYPQLVRYPQEVIPAMDMVLKDVMIALAEEDQRSGPESMRGEQGDEEINDIMSRVYKVRPYGLPACNMRDLNPSDTDKLVSVKGLVIRATPVIPDMKIGV